MSTQARVDILLALKSKIDGAETVLGHLGRLRGLLYAVAASAPVVAIKGAGALAGEIKSIAAQSGISTKALQVLEGQMAADSVKVETLNQALLTLKRNLQEAREDPKSSINKRLEALRLDAAGLQQLRPEEQLEIIGRRLETATNKDEAFNAALDLLGTKAAPKVLESLRRLGNEGLENWERLQKGMTLSPKQLDDLDRASNFIDRIGLRLKLLGASGIADTLSLANEFSDKPRETARTFSNVISSSGPVGGPLAGTGGFNPLWFVSANIQSAGAAAERARNLGKPALLGAMRGFFDPSGNHFAAGRPAIAEDPMHGRAFTPESVAAALRQQENESKMAAATLTATLERIDKSSKETQEKIEKRSGALTAAIIKDVRGTMEQKEKDLDGLVEKFRELGDASLPYRRQLEQIAALQRMGKLTADEAAAATARLTREMNRDVETMLEKSNDALRALGVRRAAMESSPFLTDREKAKARIESLERENALIERTIHNLRRLSEQPGVDKGQLSGQIRGLRDRQTGNDLEIGRSRELKGIGENIHAELTSLQNEFGTVSENIGRTFGDGIRAGMAAASHQLQLLIGDTEYWSQRLGAIGGPIMGAITASITRMFTEWIAQRAIMFIKDLIFQKTAAAAALAASMPIAMAQSAVWAAPATLATIATMGAAAAQAPISIMGAKVATMMQTMAGFADGGRVIGPGGPRDDAIFARLSNGEHVVNARAAAAIGHDRLDALNFSADPLSLLGAGPVRKPASSSAGGMFAGKQTRVMFVDHRDKDVIANALSDPRVVTRVVRIGREYRGELGVEI